MKMLIIPKFRKLHNCQRNSLVVGDLFSRTKKKTSFSFFGQIVVCLNNRFSPWSFARARLKERITRKSKKVEQKDCGGIYPSKHKDNRNLPPPPDLRKFPPEIL